MSLVTLTPYSFHLVHSVINKDYRYELHTQVKNDSYKLAKTTKKYTATKVEFCQLYFNILCFISFY
jgi:hypothetical protein